ncbi:DUF3817 domain-containing protein [Aureivirga sp. CE67]|uniref:DUF3817 domain-containing protein n=1 Tax=Aureivirga sp. CE67 TaxID=1788983 RepID=UPI0018C9453F|nr:DUF3817 domain-containing protein [Aureivirga sp. CE67]
MLKELKLFRSISIMEGLSAIILFFIAMPIKYTIGHEEPVRYVGSIHGFLFVIYVIFALYIGYKVKWDFKTLFYVMIASVFPFGTFVMDKKILIPIIQKHM